MWIVQLALKRPYTFIVAALLLLIASPLVILKTPVDIFPNINIPVVSIVFQYTGMPASEFGDRITSPFERVLTTTVNDIEHIESTALNGISVTKVYFQPKAQLPAAIAQVTAICQTVLKQLPTGITPPLIISYNASSVPILQLGLSSEQAQRAGALRSSPSTPSAPPSPTCPAAPSRIPSAASNARS